MYMSVCVFICTVYVPIVVLSLAVPKVCVQCVTNANILQFTIVAAVVVAVVVFVVFVVVVVALV